MLFLYFLFTSLFVVRMLPWYLPVEIFVRLTSSATAEGVITRYEDTNSGWREDTKHQKRRKPKNTNYRVYITYHPNEDQIFEVRNFVTGPESIPGYRDGAYNDAGEAVRKVPVSLKYRPGLEKWAIFDGGRLSAYSPMSLIILFFPLTIPGLYRLINLPLKRLRKILAEGCPTVAEVVSFREYLVGRRNKTMYSEAIFSFELDGTPRQAKYATDLKYAKNIELAFKSGKKYLILYRTDKPEVILPLIILDEPAEGSLTRPRLLNGPAPVDRAPN